MEQQPTQTANQIGKRFDYVQYDETAQTHQAEIKNLCRHLEAYITAHIPAGRAQSTALTRLEECYAWCGKGIRDDQILRNGSAELQEERNSDGVTYIPKEQ
jgi:hypothetical protein